MKKIIYLQTISIIYFVIIITGCSTKPTLINAETYVTKAEDYYSNFDYDKALINYQKALELEGENPDIYYMIGMIYGIKHQQTETDQSIIGGRANRLARIQRKDDSYYSLALRHFQKAAELGHLEARNILRTMSNNIQHQDVQY